MVTLRVYPPGEPVSTRLGGLSSGSTTQDVAGQARSGISLTSTGFRLCADHPTTGQRLWYALQLLPGTVLTVGGILLVYLLVRNAARHGIYTSPVAVRLRVLGTRSPYTSTDCSKPAG